VSMDLQGTVADSLVGRYIYVNNDGERNAVYEIMGIKDMGNGQYLLDIGEKTLIRRYVDVNNFAQGYVYDVAEGSAFRIPLSYEHEMLLGITATVDLSKVTVGDTTQITVVGERANGRTVGLEDAEIVFSVDRQGVATVTS